MNESAKKPRILIIGDAVAPTGFSRVIRSIFGPLRQQYELHQLATRYEGDPHDYSWTLYPASLGGGSVYGYHRVASLIERIQPDIVFLLYDIVFQAKYMELLRRAGKELKIVIYSPVEAGPISPELMRQLQGVTRYVLYTDYGRQEIEQSLQMARERDPEFDFGGLDVIGHGVDTTHFYPLADDSGTGSATSRRLIARKALGLDDAEHRDAFIVLNANRNMPRKRIDITLQSFALFARDKPANVKLYLHMAAEDTGWNVHILARRYGIYDRLIMSVADNSRPTFSDERLNLMYNACDVGITTSTGEGWGMVSFEHAATNAAQIVPRHTAFAELWRGAAEFVEPATTLTYPGNLTVGHIVTPEAVADALERLYRDAGYRETVAEACYQNATRAEHDWTSIAARWDKLFGDLLERNG